MTALVFVYFLLLWSLLIVSTQTLFLQVPHPLRYMPVSFVFTYARQTGKNMKSMKTTSCYYGNTEGSTRDSTHFYNRWVTEQAITLRFQRCLKFYRTFQAKDSIRNTSAITAVIKSSIKHDAVLPQIVTFAVMEKKTGHTEGIKMTKVAPDAFIAAATVGEKAHLGTKRQGSVKKSGL